MGGIIWTPPASGGGGGLATADNGLTATAGNVQMGGPLVKDTLIDIGTGPGAFNFEIGDLSTFASIFGIALVGGQSGFLEYVAYDLSNSKGASLQIVGNDGTHRPEILLFTQNPDGSGGVLELNENAPQLSLHRPGATQQTYSANTTIGMMIIDSILNKGLFYNADYSANYTSRSLPDVAWVLAQIGGSGIIDTPEKPIGSIIIFASVTDPNTPNALNYQWTQAGKLVTVRFNLDYANAGNLVRVCIIEFPPDLPTPKLPTGFNNSADIALFGSGGMGVGVANEPTTFGLVWLTTLPGNIPYVSINMETGGSYTTMWATLTYFAA